jgi:UPF0716 protein FxsA
MPGLILLLLFIGVPMLEIAVFIQVGGAIGLWWTLAIVLVTAIAGSFLLRLQGASVLMRAQQALSRGEMPLTEVFDGACLLVAGALLLTPGFVTDTVGALLFVPAVRVGLRRFLGRFYRPVTVRRYDDGSIEGEYRVVEPEPDELPPHERL